MRRKGKCKTGKVVLFILNFQVVVSEFLLFGTQKQFFE